MYRLLDKLSKTKRSRSLSDISKILILRPDRLGDVLLTLPAVYNVKSAYPDAEIYYLCRKYTSPILKSYQLINDVLIFPEDEDKDSIHQLVGEMSDLNFDLAIHLLPKASLAKASYQAKINYRLGMGYRLYSIFYNLRQFEHRKYNDYHEAEYNLRMLGLLDISTAYSEKSYGQFAFKPEDETKANIYIQEVFGTDPYILIHPGSGGSSKDWPLDHYIDLIKLLNQWNMYKIGVTGTDAEKQLLAPLLNSGLEIVDLSGQLDLIQLSLITKKSSLFISNSTGPLHLAVAMGTPVLGFYVAAFDLGPKRWGPFMRPEDQVITPNDMLAQEQRSEKNENLSKITPKNAFQRIKTILNK